MSRPRILVTGGTGYIGSHACVCLIEAGFEPVIVDNLSNSSRIVTERVARITGFQPVLHETDLRDSEAIARLVREIRPAATLHFAGLKAVGESVSDPLRYYDNNVCGTVSLLQALDAGGCRVLVFSSSATVYGDPDTVPIPETAPVRPTNPYGQTKVIVEKLLLDLCAADPRWHVSILRYFNPVGAHESGLIGEAPRGTPNNLVPYIAQVAAGKRAHLSVFGDDWPTADGSGVRDYLHVMDLAEGHVAALRHALANPGPLTLNLGTGQGVSVKEMIRAYEAACGSQIPFRISPRRPGDIATCYADASRAREVLGWQPRRSLAAMCKDSWHWQSNNPDGYQ